VSRIRRCHAMTGMGQIERFPSSCLVVRYVIGRETLAQALGNGREAPKPVIPGSANEH
jgi:hypothetical protein